MENQKNYQKICLSFLAPLPQRQRDILLKRFGLGKSQIRETLQKIGDDFGITRERVRQIERDVIVKLRETKKPAGMESIFVDLTEYFKGNGGLKKEELALVEFAKGQPENCINFLLYLHPELHYFPEDDGLFSFWALEESLINKIKEATKEIINKFKQIAKPVEEKDLFSMYNASPAFILSSVDISKQLSKGPLGEFGLVDWPQIRPKGVKDAAFLALLATQKPLHFRDIAKRANEVAGDYFNGKIVLPQTVHNELIRDERFVLVGRGIYGLKEWGYSQGTVKEIIASVLRQSASPLSKEEVLAKVKSQRLVKDNTVFLNLSDKNYFRKDQSGKYLVQES